MHHRWPVGWPVTLAVRWLRHIEEHLSVLLPLMQEIGVNFQGREFQARPSCRSRMPTGEVPCGDGGVRPRLLEISGHLADYLVTEMTGLDTLGERVVPCLQKVVRLVLRHADLPSCSAMLEREGVEESGDIAEEAVEGQL